MTGTAAQGGRLPPAFRHYNFRLYWTGQLVSLVGTHMQRAAQAWLVLTLSNDPLMLGFLVTAQWGPVLVLGLFGGIVADSFPKRPTIVATQSVAMVLAFLLAVLVATGVAELWHVLVLALLLGVTSALDIPARQTFVIEMVGRDDVVSAVALTSTLVHSAKIVGPALAGIIIAAFGLAPAFFINGLSFAAVIAGLVAMRPGELVPSNRAVLPRSPGAVLGNVGEGLRYALAHRDVLVAIGLVGAATAAGMNFQVLLPPLARDVLRTDASGYGFLMAASGVGAVAATLMVAFRGRPRPLLLPAAAVVIGLLDIVVGLSGSLAIGLVAMAAIGLAGVLLTTHANTLIQLSAPDHLRGRVMALYVTVHSGALPVGGVIFGGIAGAIGPAGSLAIGGLCTIAVGLLAAVVRSTGARDLPLVEAP